jgi:hypothetical protein
MSTVHEKMEDLQRQGFDKSMALAIAADAQRREAIELEERQATNRLLVQRARELAQLPKLGDQSRAGS